MADSIEHADPAGGIPARPTARTAPARTGTPIGAGWRAYRSWRRSRPFWAGILLVIAGAELLLIPLPMHSMGLILHIGVGGVSGILIGAVLIVAGLLLWFNPAQRMFYSIVAVLLAIAALVASNLGGFLLGTALGVLGGSLGFAWTPLAPGAAPRSLWRRRPRVPTEDVGGVADVPGDASPADEASPTGPQAVTEPGHGTVLRGFAVLPLLAIIAALLHLGSASSTQSADPSATGSPAATCTPAPTTSTTAPSPSASACASASAASPAPTPGADSTPDPGPAASASSGASASPSASPSPAPTGTAPTGTAPSFAIATSQSTLTASSATITGFAYDGVVTVPTASGDVQMMQFSATSLDLSGMQLTVSQGGGTQTTTAGSLDLTGNVVLYTTELSGDLLGFPITITPDTPIATILQWLSAAGFAQALTQVVPLPMTDVTTQQPYTSANGMTVSALDIS